MDGRVAYYPFVHEADSDDDTSKMKRKHEGRAPALTDDFSDLSFSSPPTKIRRLDVEFPPAPAIHFEHEGSDEIEATEASVDVNVDDGENMSSNEERAIVLYRPVEPAGPHFSSLSVLPHFVLAFAVRDQLVAHNNTGEERLAVVPWAPNNLNINPSRQCKVDLLNDDSDDMELEIEEDQCREDTPQVIINANGNEGSLLTDSSRYQWQHQNQMHCMLPQFPLHSAAPATPVTWSW